MSGVTWESQPHVDHMIELSILVANGPAVGRLQKTTIDADNGEIVDSQECDRLIKYIMQELF